MFSEILKKSLIITIGLTALQLLAPPKSKAPYIGYVYPSGAKQGTENLLIIGGMNLNGINEASFSGNGIKVKSIKFFRPFKRLSNDLRRELKPILKAIDEGNDPIAESKKSTQKILKKLKKQQAEAKDNPSKEIQLSDELKITPGERLVYIDKTPEEVVKIIKELSPLEYQILLKEVFKTRNVLQAAPAIAQTAIMEIDVSPDAKPGFRELRLKGNKGISNHIPFVISNMPEKITDTFSLGNKNAISEIKINTITNGQIMPGEVDKYRFKAEKGQNLSFDLQGRSLVPFLSDAVPGWFQPIISIHDSSGKQLAFADDNLFNPDPVIAFTAPKTEEYELWIRDSIYRGREDFVYRLKAKTGSPEKIKYRADDLKINLPEQAEAEPNDKLESAQSINVPTIISSKIQNSKDVDFFRFSGKKGKKIAIEIFARRLNSPMDSLIKILDEKGKILAWNDDYQWLNFGTKTHHADSYLLFELPEDGNYYIKVMETQVKGGKDFNYILRVDNPKPDFEIFMTPSAINTNSFVATPINLNVFRKDGFDEPIDISLKKAPEGAKLTGGRIPAGVNKITVTIDTPRKIKPGQYELILEAKANINGKTIANDVIPTDRIMQAFLYTHLVPTQEPAILNVIRRGWLPVKPVFPEGKVKISPGGKIDFKLQDNLYQANIKKKKKGLSVDEINFHLLTPPKGLKITKTGYEDKHHLMQLEAAPDSKPWQGNLIIECSAKGKWKKNGKSGTYNYVIGALPAIPVEVKALIK